MSDQTTDAASAAKRGEARWKEVTDGIAERNDAARKRGKAERKARELQQAQTRSDADKRSSAQMVKRDRRRGR